MYLLTYLLTYLNFTAHISWIIVCAVCRNQADIELASLDALSWSLLSTTCVSGWIFYYHHLQSLDFVINPLSHKRGYTRACDSSETWPRVYPALVTQRVNRFFMKLFPLKVLKLWSIIKSTLTSLYWVYCGPCA